jgi:hypothetical protein
MTLPGASYALEELVELGGTWQPTAFFVGTGTMEAHQIMLERTSGFLQIKQTL